MVTVMMIMMITMVPLSANGNYLQVGTNIGDWLSEHPNQSRLRASFAGRRAKADVNGARFPPPDTRKRAMVLRLSHNSGE